MARTENQRAIPLWLYIAVAAAVALRIAVAFVPEKKEAPERSLVRWVPPQAARPIALASGKPILYDFSAAWCGPCKLMEKAIFNEPRYAARINARFVPVRVVDRQQEDGANPPEVEALQTKYGVGAFPTIVVASADGRLIDKTVGFGGPEQFDKLLR